jgi:hypothetical protein
VKVLLSFAAGEGSSFDIEMASEVERENRGAPLSKIGVGELREKEQKREKKKVVRASM